MKKIFAIIFVFATLFLNSCSVNKNDIGNISTENFIWSETEEKNFTDSELFNQKDQSEKTSHNSQYWLPVKYKSYTNYGIIIHESEWNYDENGFFISRKDGEHISGPYDLEYDGSNLFIYTSDDHSSGLVYQFDEDGNLYSSSMNISEVYKDRNEYEEHIYQIIYENAYNSYSNPYYNYSDEEIESKARETAEKSIQESKASFDTESISWLDNDGNIKSEYNSSQSIYFHNNSTVGSQKISEEDLQKYLNNEIFKKTVLASVWKSAIENEDGTITTNVYYSNGQLGESIIWKPVSKQAFAQNYFFDNDWTEKGTLIYLYKG